MKNHSRINRSKHITHSVAFAFLLIIAGVAFLGFNLGFIPMPYKEVIFSWPMLLIALGVLSFSKCHFWSGGILVIIGGFFIIPDVLNVCPQFLPVNSTDFVHLYWPVLLILAGIISLIYWLVPHSSKHSFSKYHDSTDYTCVDENINVKKEKWQNEKGYFKRQSVFSSGKHIFLDPEFKGGEIDTVLGETILDLRKTNLPDGDTFLEINTVLGGVTIFVPTDWCVDIRIESIFYAFEDKRFEKGATDITKRLVILGSGVLGGGELRN